MNPARRGWNLNIKISELEREAYGQAATAAGMTLSDWMRTRLRVACLAELGSLSLLSIPGAPLPKRELAEACA